MEEQKKKEIIDQYIDESQIVLIRDILMYEIHSHWFASRVSNRFLQSLLGKYFAWKVSRKYKRYRESMLMRNIVLNKKN